MNRKKIKTRAKNPIDFDYREPVRTPEQEAAWWKEFKRDIGYQGPDNIERITVFMMRKFVGDDCK